MTQEELVNPAKVELYVYDLSRGMAKTLSMQLTGTHIEGIWHTSVVVYGLEFFYGQGITYCVAGTTHHGAPLQKINMGSTFIPDSVLMDYIENMKEEYTPSKYHLLDFNCNHFSKDLLQFLNGSAIPGHIQDLPNTFLATPFGQMIRPTIDNFYRQSSQMNATTGVPNMPFGLAHPQPIQTNPTAAAATATTTTVNDPQKTIESILRPTTLNGFKSLTNNVRAVVVVFINSQDTEYSNCQDAFYKQIAKVNQSLSLKSKYPQLESFLMPIIVDNAEGKEILEHFDIESTPAFIYLNYNQMVDKTVGYNTEEMELNIKKLMFKAYQVDI